MAAPKPRSSRSAAGPVIIQVELPRTSDEAGALHRTLATLEEFGVHVDADHPPVRVGRKASRQFVLRGHATPSAIKLANTELAVTIFPDLEID
jgi:hypothetical protein